MKLSVYELYGEREDVILGRITGKMAATRSKAAKIKKNGVPGFFFLSSIIDIIATKFTVYISSLRFKFTVYS